MLHWKVSAWDFIRTVWFHSSIVRKNGKFFRVLKSSNGEESNAQDLFGYIQSRRPGTSSHSGSCGLTIAEVFDSGTSTVKGVYWVSTLENDQDGSTVM